MTGLRGPDESDYDLYSGFDQGQADQSNDVLSIELDQLRQEAMTVSRGLRRPSGKVTPRVKVNVQSGAVSSPKQGLVIAPKSTQTRPLTSVRPAGYSSGRDSGGRTITKHLSAGGTLPSHATPGDDPHLLAKKYRAMEKSIINDLDESCIAQAKGDRKLALEKAKEAARKHRSYVREKATSPAEAQTNSLENFGGPSEVDIFYSVLFNLGTQFLNCRMHAEALKTYEAIVRNKAFINVGLLNVNIGNIHFHQRDYSKAIKHYKMCLDQLTRTHLKVKTKILTNIAVCFFKTRLFREALDAFQQIMAVEPTIRTGFSILLCQKALGQYEGMRVAFQDLLKVDVRLDDEERYSVHADDRNYSAILEVIRNDNLRQMERRRKLKAEDCIFMAGRIVASETGLSMGVDWTIEQMQLSQFQHLSSDMEIEKVIRYLRQKNFSEAAATLRNLERKLSDSEVAVGAAATNLSFLHNLISAQDATGSQAEAFAEIALRVDRYNSAALVNRGNIYFQKRDFERSRHYYQDAVEQDSSCSAALFNLGLSEKRLGHYPEALRCFNKLLAILVNDPQVIYHIADLHDITGDKTKATDWFIQLTGIVPKDVSILCRLGTIAETLGDRNQAFHHYMEAFRCDPNNIGALEWLGAFSVESQYLEKAVEFFRKGALVQPNNVRWQLMIASCYRRSGSYQKAIDLYKDIHKRFPDNLECMRFLVRLCEDLKLPEAKDFANRLKRAEELVRVRKERMEGGAKRDHRNDKGTGKESEVAVADDSDYGAYADPLGSSEETASQRPKTASRCRDHHEDFTGIVLDDDLLPC